jgi:hypothetical protein
MPIDPDSSHTPQDISYEIAFVHANTGVPVSVKLDMFSNSEVQGDQTFQELVDLLNGTEMISEGGLYAIKRVNTRNLGSPTP